MDDQYGAEYVECQAMRYAIPLRDTWINERWDNYGNIMANYRGWLMQLPTDVAEKIAFRNGERIFRR